jgi:uncharacterized membrane protein YphA (DoxX/SURF4 family)
MRTNPFVDAWLFLSGNTDEHRASGVGWLLTALFLALLAASIWIAWANWRQDAAQRTKEHVATWFMRVMIGVMFYQGSFDFHRWIAKNIFLNLLPVLDPVAYITELSLAVSFILGFFVRPMGVIGMLFVVQLWLGLYRQPEEWPWLYVFLIFVQGFFVVTGAGKSLGLDGLIARQEAGPFSGNSLFARIYRKLA